MIALGYCVIYHLYLDNDQLYLPFDPKSEKAELSVEILLSITKKQTNKQKTKQNKTEFLEA